MAQDSVTMASDVDKNNNATEVSCFLIFRRQYNSCFSAFDEIDLMLSFRSEDIPLVIVR